MDRKDILDERQTITAFFERNVPGCAVFTGVAFTSNMGQADLYSCRTRTDRVFSCSGKKVRKVRF